MSADLEQLLRRPEAEDFDRKSALDPTSSYDCLKLVADLVAMANTRGGGILIGSSGTIIPDNHRPQFDSARLDDRVNSLTEPRVGGVRSSFLGDDFVLVEVEKSPNPPHIFRRDGTYMSQTGRNSHVFSRGDVFVRHSTKSERASRVDFERWFEERQNKLFENVKLVFEASPQAQIQISNESVSIPVRIAPEAAGAQPVYDLLLTAAPFRDLSQELLGAVKAWKTSHQLMNETQLYKAYSARREIAEPEIHELLLRSCWERYLPGYYWAGRMNGRGLLQILAEITEADRYPASQEALRVASLLPRDHAKRFFRSVEISTKKSSKQTVKKLETVLRARGRKYEVLREILGPKYSLNFLSGDGMKEVTVAKVDEGTFEEILASLLTGKRDNRQAFKVAELIVYGRALTQLDFGVTEESEEIGQAARNTSELDARAKLPTADRAE